MSNNIYDILKKMARLEQPKAKKLTEGVIDPDYRGDYDNAYDEFDALSSKSALSPADMARRDQLARTLGVRKPTDMAKVPGMRARDEEKYKTRAGDLEAAQKARNLDAEAELDRDLERMRKFGGTPGMNESKKKAKPDYIDIDKDGDKEEPMKKADKDKAKGGIAEAVARVEQQLSEKYMGFKKTVAAIKKGGSAENPEAVAAAIGRKKYGKEKFQKAAAAGKKLGEDQVVAEGSVEESGLQAYLGKKKYGEQGMRALQQAGREGASKEKMAKIRARHDKMDEGEYDKYSEIQPEHIKARPGSSDPRGTEEYQTGIYPDPDLERVGMGAYGPKAKIIPKIQGIAPEKRGEYMSYFNDDNMPHDSKHTKIFLPNPKKGDTYDDLLKNADHYTVFGPKTPSTLDKIKRAVGIDEDAYNEDMLSPKEKSFAALAKPKDKITYADRIAGAKKGKKTEGNKFSGNLMKARAQGLKQADLDGDGDMEKVTPGKSNMREGWEEMQKYLEKKRGPESKGGAGKKAGTRYGGSAQRDDDEETDGEGQPAVKKKGRPKGTGGGAKFSFKKPKD